jgi:hypothetical protein
MWKYPKEIILSIHGICLEKWRLTTDLEPLTDGDIRVEQAGKMAL